MEKECFDHDLEIEQSAFFHKIYSHIVNLLVNLKSTDYNSIKNIIFNFFEQNVNKHDFKMKNITQDKLFIMLLYKLCINYVIDNPILANLIQNKVIKTIEDMNSLFSFRINPNTNQNINATVKTISKHNYKKESFSLHVNAENNYHNLICSYPDICPYIKQYTIQILNSISFSGSKIPTSPIKFKNFISSFIKNQRFTRLFEGNKKIKIDEVVSIITEGIIIDFIKVGIISFPSEAKIQYYMNIIEREKYRLTKAENEAQSKSNGS